MRRLLLWGPPIVYMAAIFHLSSQSQPLPEVTEHVWDKLLHTIEYGGLAALFARALIGEGVGYVYALLAAIVLTSTYGASDEYHQLFVPLRSADIQDWFADTIGAAVGAVGAVAYALTVSRSTNQR